MNGSVSEMKMMSPPSNMCALIGRMRNSRMRPLTNQQAARSARYTIAMRNSLDRSSSRCSRKPIDFSVDGAGSAIARRRRGFGFGSAFRSLRRFRRFLGWRRRRRDDVGDHAARERIGLRRRLDRAPRLLERLDLDLALEARLELVRPPAA